MLRIFSSKKSKKDKQTDHAHDTDTLESSHRQTKAGLSLSILSGNGAAGNNSGGTPPSQVLPPMSHDASGSLPYGDSTRRDAAGDAVERGSNYSAISGDSDDYVPREQRLAERAKSNDGNASTVNATGGGGGGAAAAVEAAAAAAAARGDAPDVVLPAVRYVYDATRQKWLAQYVRLRVLHPNRGVDQDDLHVYFAADLILLKRCQPAVTDDDGPVASAASVTPPEDTALIETEEFRAGQMGLAAVIGGEAGGYDATSGVFKTIPVQLRLFRHSITSVTDEDYRGEAECQAVAEGLAYTFNRFPTAPGARLLPIPLLTNRNMVRIDRASLPVALRKKTKGFFSYITEDSGDLVMLAEPDVRECAAIGISFSMQIPKKGNAASSRGEGDDVCPPLDASRFDNVDLKQVADAFTHFSYEQNKGRRMVHGFVRCSRYLLDPFVYTPDRQGFGLGNGGAKAIDAWVGRHRCNAICRAYGLEPVNDLPAEPDRTSAESKAMTATESETGKLKNSKKDTKKKDDAAKAEKKAQKEKDKEEKRAKKAAGGRKA